MKEQSRYYDQICGSLVGGAIGDALGYAVEFESENAIFGRYGESGITEYELNALTGKAIISDDTQMTLFTANGILYAEEQKKLHGAGKAIYHGVARAYLDWYDTQFYYSKAEMEAAGHKGISWILDAPELFARRAPGGTCLSALRSLKIENDGIKNPVNNSKGCGGIMRVAPVALYYHPGINYEGTIEDLDYEGAETAAITHGHSLGYMPAAVVTHIISRILEPECSMSLKEIVIEARDTMDKVFAGDPYLPYLKELIDRAIRLSENEEPDLDNIHRLGEGWVAEETLAISLYCALKYQNDFSKAIIVSVNHKGDSDSTGAVTGNILGALIGYNAIEDKWKENLELLDVILAMGTDTLAFCVSPDGSHLG